MNDFLFLSLPFPTPSFAAHITWLGEAEGKGVSNAKSLERTARIFCMISVSGRNTRNCTVQGKKEQNEKIPSPSPRGVLCR